MKRAISILTIIALLFTLAACAPATEEETGDGGGGDSPLGDVDVAATAGDGESSASPDAVDTTDAPGDSTMTDISNNAVAGGDAPVDSAEPESTPAATTDKTDSKNEEPTATPEPTPEPTPETTPTPEPTPEQKEDKPVKNPQVTIEMEDGGIIVAELYPDKAPNTVNNFISLILDGYYDGLIFHRVIPGFMIQGGCPTGTGTGGPGYSIKGEFSNNGFSNDTKHLRGTLAMARSGMPDSAGSQFFICVAASSWLDGDYAAFGRVLSGMDIVDAIVAVDRNSSDKPYTEQKMKTVTVDTFGVEYPAPETIVK